MRPYRLSLLLLTLIGFGANVHAQTTGQIRGTVTGPDGKPLSGARVRVQSSNGIDRESPLTNDSGAYEFSLPVGTYHVSAKVINHPLPRIRVEHGDSWQPTSRLKNVDLTVDENVVIDFVIPIACTQCVATIPRVSIEVKQDVPIIHPSGPQELRGTLYLSDPSESEVRLIKGQRFQMVQLRGEGGCWISFEGKDYALTSCPWREGFRDHQTDIFAMVKP